MSRGIHTKPNSGETTEWLTPPEIIDVFGPFDLDPCAPVKRPWDTAAAHFTTREDGLSREWAGTVWLNPPYSAAACDAWLGRLADHGHGMALVATRTETDWFFEHVWERADAVLFLRGRLYFHRPDGTRANGNAGHGSVLVAYGLECRQRLRDNRHRGKFISLV